MRRSFFQNPAMRRAAPWAEVSRALGVRPIVSADVGRRQPVRVERYLFQARRQKIPALPTALLVVHLGGARVSGGRARGRASHYLPSFAVFLAAGCPSEWQLEGPVDVAGFYLPSSLGARLSRGLDAGPDAGAEYGFTDPLVTATCRQIVDDLRDGSGRDTRFIESALHVLLLQTERVLSGRAGTRLYPAPSQLTRLKSTLGWIDRNLNSRLENEELARQAGLSESHFRHAFVQAFSVSPRQYVRQRRLERARELLAVTGRPIAQIASDCGFASQSYLTTCFKGRHGVTPAAYRRALRQHGRR